MPERDDPKSGWRKGDDGASATDTKLKRKHKAKVATPLQPAQSFKSTRTVVVEGEAPPTVTSAPGSEGDGYGDYRPESKERGDSARAGATRRKKNELHHAAVEGKISKKLGKETKKALIAKEKAEESERIRAEKERKNNPNHDDEDSDDGFDETAEVGWLQPETRVARRKATQMRGVRTFSVENLENDDLNHLSAERHFVKPMGVRCPSPFGRRLIEDRQELVGILNLPRNKRMRKAGIKESHLASIVDVYTGVMSNALARIEEDEAGDAGPLATGKKAEEKGVRVSFFAATLGISPYLFMREVLWASNRLYAHAIPGEMNRATWVFGCLALCLMSEKELVEFIFHTCKLTDAGELEMGELARLARGLHLSNDAFWPAFSQQLEDIVKSHENGDLIMTLDFFRDMHHKFPMILYPALRLQELVQRRTLGLHTWTRINNRLDRYLVRQKLMANSKPCCLWVLLGLKT